MRRAEDRRSVNFVDFPRGTDRTFAGFKSKRRACARLRFGSCRSGGVVILEHRSKLLPQFRRVLVPVNCRGMQYSEFHHFVYVARNGN